MKKGPEAAIVRSIFSALMIIVSLFVLSWAIRLFGSISPSYWRIFLITSLGFALGFGGSRLIASQPNFTKVISFIVFLWSTSLVAHVSPFSEYFKTAIKERVFVAILLLCLIWLARIIIPLDLIRGSIDFYNTFMEKARNPEGNPIKEQQLSWFEKAIANIDWLNRFYQRQRCKFLLRDVNHYIMRGYPDDALKATLEAEKIARDSLSKTDRAYYMVLNNLSFTYLLFDRYSESEAILEEAIETARKHGKDAIPSLGLCLTNMGILMFERNRFDEARPYFEEGASIIKEHINSTNPEYATCLAYLGYLERRDGRYSSAHKYMSDAFTIIKKTSGRSHPEFKKIKDLLAE